MSPLGAKTSAIGFFIPDSTVVCLNPGGRFWLALAVVEAVALNEAEDSVPVTSAASEYAAPEGAMTAAVMVTLHT